MIEIVHSTFMDPSKVPMLEDLETALSNFDRQTLISQPQRLKLLQKLRAALVFIRDYDKPTKDIIEREARRSGPGRQDDYSPYNPTIRPYDYSYNFVT